MKALLIVLGLLLGVGGAVWVLFRDAYTDLRRIEDDTRVALEAARQALNESTTALSALRAVRPQMLRLDEKLTELRQSLDAQEKRLDQLSHARPASGDPRQRWLEERDAAKRQAQDLQAGCATFHERVKLLDGYVRDVEPLLMQMQANAGSLFGSRNALADTKRLEIDGLVVKIDQLTSEASATQRLAGQVLDSAAKDIAQARTLAETVKREVTRILAEQQAIGQKIKSALEAAPASK